MCFKQYDTPHLHIWRNKAAFDTGYKFPYSISYDNLRRYLFFNSTSKISKSDHPLNQENTQLVQIFSSHVQANNNNEMRL